MNEEIDQAPLCQSAAPFATPSNAAALDGLQARQRWPRHAIADALPWPSQSAEGRFATFLARLILQRLVCCVDLSSSRHIFEAQSAFESGRGTSHVEPTAESAKLWRER